MKKLGKENQENKKNSQNVSGFKTIWDTETLLSIKDSGHLGLSLFDKPQKIEEEMIGYEREQ